MNPEKEFAKKVMDFACLVLRAAAPKTSLSTDKDFTHGESNGIFTFNTALGQMRSDSITEMAETVIHHTEEVIKRRLADRDVVFINVMIPESEFDTYLKRNANTNVSLYTDTFRRIVAQMRKDYKV